MYTYRLHLEHGSDAGQASYADNVNPGEFIWLGPGRQYRVLSVVRLEEDEDSPVTAFLMIGTGGSGRAPGLTQKVIREPHPPRHLTPGL